MDGEKEIETEKEIRDFHSDEDEESEDYVNMKDYHYVDSEHSDPSDSESDYEDYGDPVKFYFLPSIVQTKPFVGLPQIDQSKPLFCEDDHGNAQDNDDDDDDDDDSEEEVEEDIGTENRVQAVALAEDEDDANVKKKEKKKNDANVSNVWIRDYPDDNDSDVGDFPDDDRTSFTKLKWWRRMALGMILAMVPLVMIRKATKTRRLS